MKKLMVILALLVPLLIVNSADATHYNKVAINFAYAQQPVYAALAPVIKYAAAPVYSTTVSLPVTSYFSAHLPQPQPQIYYSQLLPAAPICEPVASYAAGISYGASYGHGTGFGYGGGFAAPVYGFGGGYGVNRFGFRSGFNGGYGADFGFGRPFVSVNRFGNGFGNGYGFNRSFVSVNRFGFGAFVNVRIR